MAEELSLAKLDLNDNDAVTVYHKAMQYEQAGDMTQAIELYRKAFLLDPDVHTKIVLPRSVVEKKTFVPVVKGAWEFLMLRISMEQDAKLLTLEMRLLVRICKWLGTMHLTSLERLAQVCRQLYAATRDEGVWRLLTWWQVGLNRHFRSHFRKQLADAPARMVFWSHLPILHFDGVYIAQLGYYRQGMPDLNSSTNLNPILHVVYWRYIRFWNSTFGCQVTTLCTTDPPVKVIPILRNVTAIKGKWRRLELGEGSDPTIADRFIELRMSDDKHHYRMTLFIRPGSRSLVCQEYRVQRKGRSDEVEIEVSSWKRFYFSRVRSYH